MAEAVKRQFKCFNCGGRVWQDSAAQSDCRECSEPGEMVPVGEEIKLSQFKCDNCDGRAWYGRAEVSKCRKCDSDGALVPEGEEIEWRQFVCDNCDGRRWIEMAERSKCRDCKNYGTMVPHGEETGVFLCKFKCSHNCKCTDPQNPYGYRVKCEMTDTAKCYSCRDQGHEYDNSPYGFLPLRRIHKKTSNKHECSKCNGSGDCPNLSLRHLHKFIWRCVTCGHKWNENAEKSLCHKCNTHGERI